MDREYEDKKRTVRERLSFPSLVLTTIVLAIGAVYGLIYSVGFAFFGAFHHP